MGTVTDARQCRKCGVAKLLTEFRQPIGKNGRPYSEHVCKQCRDTAKKRADVVAYQARKGDGKCGHCGADPVPAARTARAAALGPPTSVSPASPKALAGSAAASVTARAAFCVRSAMTSPDDAARIGANAFAKPVSVTCAGLLLLSLASSAFRAGSRSSRKGALATPKEPANSVPCGTPKAASAP